MEIQDRAKYFATAVNHLYFQQGIRGKLSIASRGARYLSLRIRLRDPLKMQVALNLADNLALATSTAAVRSERDPDYPGLITYQFELPEDMWKSYTRQDLSGLGIGFSDGQRQVEFSLDGEPHTLVAGATGCGKTVAVSAIMLSLCQTYTPTELKLTIVDPDGDYAPFANEEHLALPVAHEQGEIDSVIGWVHNLYRLRKQGNIREDTPHLLVIDEAEDTLDKPERLALIQQMARGGRKFQVHLLLATQNPKQSKLPDIIGQLGNRLVGKCDNAQTSVVLSGRPGLGAHRLSSGGGDFIHVNGSIERFQVAMPTQADYDKLTRAEVGWLETEGDTSVIEDIDEYVPPVPGRRPNQISPQAIAYYLLHDPAKVTQREAKEILSIARYNHVEHRDFAAAVIAEILRLRAQKREVVSGVR